MPYAENPEDLDLDTLLNLIAQSRAFKNVVTPQTGWMPPEAAANNPIALDSRYENWVDSSGLGKHLGPRGSQNRGNPYLWYMFAKSPESQGAMGGGKAIADSAYGDWRAQAREYALQMIDAFRKSQGR